MNYQAHTLASAISIALAVSCYGGALPAVAQSESEVPQVEDITDRARQNIAEFVQDEIEAGKREVTESAREGIRGFFRSIGDFFIEKVGINLYEGFVLLGQFFLWLFEALASLVKWLLSL